MKRMGFDWNLRRLMAGRDMYQTTDLVPTGLRSILGGSCGAFQRLRAGSVARLYRK